MTPRHFRLQQSAADVLRGNRQAPAQAIEHRQAGGGIAELESPAQRRIRQAVALAARPPVTPLLRLGYVTKITVDHH